MSRITGFLKCTKHPNQRIRQDKRTGYLYCSRCRVNRNRRIQNAALHELCGTSARAARLDMGL